MSNNEGYNNFNNDRDLLYYMEQENLQSHNTSVENINEFKINGQIQNKNKNEKIPNTEREEKLNIELKNIQMLILQRSLYILKKKFEINKRELQIIYQKYRDENYMQLKCINVDYLLELYKEILDTTQFTMLPYTNFNELITADLMTELNAGKSKAVLKALVKFTTVNIEKYNRIYFEKKMRKKKLIEENEKQKKREMPQPDMEDYSATTKIVKINKRGKIIRTFEEMIENNKEFEVGDDNIIATLNEDDMSVINSKKLLYSDVIPLIIADFLQEYLKNNEYVAIVSTSNVSDDQENIKLNQNIKSLFDNDIIKFYNNLNKVDPNHENKEKLKNLLFELMNVENQIKIYQNLILEKSSKGANVKHLMNMVKKLNEQQSILQKKINQINSSSKTRKSNVAEISIINSNATNSVFGSSVDKINKSKKDKSNEKNNIIKVAISGSKSNKSLKTVKNTKYKLASNSSNNSINSKKVITSNSNYNNSNTNSNNILMTDGYGVNSQSTNGNENSINNIINDNIKYNYYYNNDNFYYQHGIKFPESKEELRNNSLLEIFYFYTKQHTFIGQTPTFQEILKSEEHLDLATFGKFCVEFKILVKPNKIAEIFKKNALNSKELNYANFVKTLQKLSVCANEEKKQYLMERIKIYKMKLKEIKEKNKKEGIKDENNEQNKSKEKEENLSGIKSEGEAEDEKCEQEKNLENQNNEMNNEGNNNEINNENINANDKKSSNSKNSKNSDKDKDKKSYNSDNNMEKINEIKEENNLDSNDENNNNDNNENAGDNQDKNLKKNNKEKQKKNNQNSQNDKPISTNLKYYQKTKAKIQSKNKKQKNKMNSVKPKTNTFLMMETKEEIQEKINKLQQDYDKLNQKTNTQLEEEFYQYLEIDDMNSYRKKMVGFLIPFLNREHYSRFPLQSVARPVKRDPKMQKEMHKILVQRHEELKKEKELKQMKEKNMLFEKRKKKFEIESKKIQQKLSKKNDYIQLKMNEEDYQKEKMNKLTWQQIQKSDYDTFIINEKDKIKNPNLDEIFTNQSNQFEEVGDYLKNFRIKPNVNKPNNNNNINININNINNISNNNFNGKVYESSSKTEPFAPKFDVNLSRISSGKNQANNSEYDIVNVIESKSNK